MGALKELNFEIELFVLSNRSMAEYSPLSLLNKGCKALDSFYELFSSDDLFENYINEILDDNE